MKRPIYLSLIIVACMCLTLCNPRTEQKAMVVDNGPAMKARYSAVNTAFNTGNVDAIDTLLAANSVDYSEDTTMHLPKGPAGLKAMVGMVREGSPDLKSEIKMMVAEGDLLMVYGTMAGTNTGPMMGMPATNKPWSSDFTDIVRFGPDMKMTEHWGVYDQMKMMKDLGLMPPPPADKKGKK